MRLPISDQQQPWSYLTPFRDIAGFLPKTATPPLFHPKFGDVPRSRKVMLVLQEAKIKG